MDYSLLHAKTFGKIKMQELLLDLSHLKFLITLDFFSSTTFSQENQFHEEHIILCCFTSVITSFSFLELVIIII